MTESTVTSVQLAGAVKVGGSSIGHDVLSGVRKASNSTGVSFSFLLAKAGRESSFQTDADNAKSTAHGLYQFTEQTWFEQIKNHGAQYGHGDLAAAIKRTGTGRLTVDDPDLRSHILGLRQDPVTSSAMAAEYAAQNRRHLSNSLGRPASDADLYLAHFLGPGGAADFLKALDRAPQSAADSVVPAAARSNRSIFYAADGAPRSLADVYQSVSSSIDRLVKRYAAASGIPERAPMPMPPKPTPPPSRPDVLLATHGQAHQNPAPFIQLAAVRTESADATVALPTTSADLILGTPSGEPPRPQRKPPPEDFARDPNAPAPTGPVGLDPEDTRIAEGLRPEAEQQAAARTALLTALQATTSAPEQPNQPLDTEAIARLASQSFPLASLGSTGGARDNMDEHASLTLRAPGLSRPPQSVSGSVSASEPSGPLGDGFGHASGPIPTLPDMNGTRDGETGSDMRGPHSNFVIAAVLESFDPNNNLTRVEGRIPTLSPRPDAVSRAAMTPPPVDQESIKTSSNDGGSPLHEADGGAVTDGWWRNLRTFLTG